MLLGMANTQNNQDHCFTEVRRRDKDRFLSGLFAPEPNRSRLFALYAFNAELERLHAHVSEPMVGEIRLQWWRDSVEDIFNGGRPTAPIAAAMYDAIVEADLPRGPIDKLIDAHGADLYENALSTPKDLEEYLASTDAALILLACKILDGQTSKGLGENAFVAEAAGLCGRAVGITRFVKRARLGQTQLPIFATSIEFMDRAKAHLQDLKPILKKTPWYAGPALLPASLAELDLQRLRRAFDAKAEHYREPPVFRRQLRLFRARLTGRF
jgi:phytoene synthase